MKGVALGKIVEEFHLKVLRGAGRICRPAGHHRGADPSGLPLKGFFEHFNPERLQVIGQVETTYLQGMSHEERAERLDQFFTYDFPAVIISRGMEPLPEMVEAAEKHDRTLLGSQLATAELISSVITYLTSALAPSITRHGVLLECMARACC